MIQLLIKSVPWRISANYDIPIRLINVPVPRYGRQYHAIERPIRAPVDYRKHVWSSAFLDSTHEPAHYIEVFGNTRKKEVKLDNPLSFDQCAISSVLLYTDFVLHNFPTDQVIVINAGSTPQEVLILRGAYDIETIIAMLNESDAFPVRIGV